MSTNAIVRGDYTHFKHVKTRKVVILEVEVPEELFQHVINTLGMPIGGESKPVAVALLDSSTYNKPPVLAKSDIQQTEGGKLRTRAVLLCQDGHFKEYCWEKHGTYYEDGEKSAAQAIYNFCGINSRSQLAFNINAQEKFKEMLIKFDSWKLENKYADNLSKL
jgi:hypothetical protein